MRRARVLLSEPVGLLDYRIPEGLFGQVHTGVPVRVPLGNRQTSGYVAAVEEGPPQEGVVLREIVSLDEDRPELPPTLIELLLFAADYYLLPPGEMLAAAVPSLSRTGSQIYRITELGEQLLEAEDSKESDAQILALGRRFRRGFTTAAVQRELGCNRRSASARLKRHVERGWLVPVSRKKSPRQVLAYERTDVGPEALSTRQSGALALLQRIPEEGSVTAAELASADRNAYARLRALEKAGLVRRRQVAQRVRPKDAPAAESAPPEATAEQSAAISAITDRLEQGGYQTFLLQGVTGSGKTEVYLRVISRALELGHTALVLVPEIALTPQLGARFRARFGDEVATFHSALTPAERRDEWERVASGRARIGLGARSAIFLPLRSLGIVIVDEEYETSFKQEESPRYNARDLAVVRGHKEGAVVVLGSATPALETRANADAGRYAHLVLSRRVHAQPMPAVKRLSLATEARVEDSSFTVELAEQLERALRADEQAVLFLNRRGFSPYIYCRDCGHAFRCTDCDVALTLHRRRGVLLCHYCGFEEMAPESCPGCLGHRLNSYGLGTERVEEELHRLLGDVPVSRLDRDTVRKRQDLHRQLDRFARGETRILIGTQMVAKGHDFPGVTLVGVLFADAALNFPDFRAAERTFQLLTQVSGRAGRAHLPGQVIVQAYETEHYAIRAAAAHDFEAFIDEEMKVRQELRYPPYSHLALLRCEAASEHLAQEHATRVGEGLRDATATKKLQVAVLGPAPAPLARLRGFWRVQVLLKARSRSELREVLCCRLPRPPVGVRQILDVDPFNML